MVGSDALPILARTKGGQDVVTYCQGRRGASTSLHRSILPCSRITACKVDRFSLQDQRLLSLQLVAQLVNSIDVYF